MSTLKLTLVILAAVVSARIAPLPSRSATYNSGKTSLDECFVRTTVVGEKIDTKYSLKFEPLDFKVKYESVNVTENSVVFKLKRVGKSWLPRLPKKPFEEVFVTGIVSGDGSTVFDSGEKVSILRLFPIPSISESSKKVSSSNATLAIDGTNLSPKFTEFKFSNGLKYQRVDASLTRAIVHGLDVGASSGVVYVEGVNTGPGMMLFDKPVKVGTISTTSGGGGGGGGDGQQQQQQQQRDATFELIAPPAPFKIYEDSDKELSIKGKRLGSHGKLVLKFKQPGGPTQGLDYEMSVKSPSTLVLKRTPKGRWAHGNDFPVPISVVSVKPTDGDPFETDSFSFAFVYKRPKISASVSEIYRRNSKYVSVYGKGFVLGSTTVGLAQSTKTSDSFVEIDSSKFFVDVVDSNSMEIRLKANANEWAKDLSKPRLKLVWIDTGAGKIDFNGVPITIATLVDDEGASKELVAKFPHLRVYQSFPKKIEVEFSSMPVEITDQAESGKKLEVKIAQTSDPIFGRLKSKPSEHSPGVVEIFLGINDDDNDEKNDGFKWSNRPGDLTLMELEGFPLGDLKRKRGLPLGKVLKDPQIDVSKTKIELKNTQSYLLKIHGVGFSYALQAAGLEENVKKSVWLQPDLSQGEDFDVWLDDSGKTLSLELRKGRAWSGVESSAISKPVNLYLKAIDAGAGKFELNALVAKIVPDTRTMLCTDDCEFSRDGSCDDVPAFKGAKPYCEWGTDCGDCGPRDPDAEDAAKLGISSELVVCEDTCGAKFTHDGVCDDGRPGAWNAWCALGTDCSDCGPVPSTRFKSLDLCSSGNEGTETNVGLPCVFPVQLDDGTVIESGCVADSKLSVADFSTAGNWGWCATTENFQVDKKWASCAWCVDVVGGDFEPEYEPVDISVEARSEMFYNFFVRFAKAFTATTAVAFGLSYLHTRVRARGGYRRVA